VRYWNENCPWSAWGPVMAGLIQDVTYGWRLLRRNPGFTAAAVLSLALGIGANTTVFSMFDAVLLRSFAVEEPSRLVNVYTSVPGRPHGRSSFPTFEDVRDRSGAFSAVLARTYWPVSIRGTAGPEVVLGNMVSANYFAVLGVQPLLGRGFRSEEGAAPGISPVAVLSHRLWRRSFAADPGTVGGTVRINNFPFTVIGVAPEGFTGSMAGFACDVWVPITMIQRVAGIEISLTERGGGWLDIVGRLKNGVQPLQAQEALNGLAARLRGEYPATNRNKGFTVVAGQPSRFPIAALGRGVSTAFRVLLGIVGVVLLIACSNLAHLMLAKGVARRQEIATRLALGASHGRILRQLLTESVLISLMAGAASLLLASWLIELFGSIRPPSPIPVSVDLRLDATVLTFTFLLSLSVGIIFGLMPAWRVSRLSPQAALRDRGSSQGWHTGRSRAQSGLVAAQVALSLLLLIVTGLSLRSLQNAVTIDPGFEANNRLAVGLNLTYAQYTEEDGRVFYGNLLERVRRLPGVERAGLAVFLPLSFASQTAAVSVEGYSPGENENLLIDNNSVSEGYFETLGIPILRGRAIDARDGQGAEPVVVINETMARRFWGSREALDQAVTISGSRHRVIGIARDAKSGQLDEQPAAFFYRPLAQVYAPFTTLIVKSAGDPQAMLGAVVGEVQTLDPNLPLHDVKTLPEHMKLSQYPATIIAFVVGGFGLLAFLLAMVGIYGVMAYQVGGRTQEFGIRVAVGATQADILRLVLRRGLAITVLGTIAGLASAAALHRMLAGLLVGVSPLDPAVYTGVTVALTATALLACYVPARRAAAMEPASALRHE